MENFPSNSHKSQEAKKAKEEKPEKSVEKVIQGEVVVKKKPFGVKFKEVFLGAELKTASKYIASDVLLPALRNMVVEATSRGIERLIYGDSAPPRRSGYGGGPRVNYNRPSERYGPQQRAYLPGQSHQIQPRRQDIADIVLLNREDAELVVERLGDILDAWDVVSVADLYDLVGLPSTYVDNSWGWTSEAIKYVNIRQTRDGFLLEMPRTEPI